MTLDEATIILQKYQRDHPESQTSPTASVEYLERLPPVERDRIKAAVRVLGLETRNAVAKLLAAKIPLK